jgi:hypothetical protein
VPRANVGSQRIHALPGYATIRRHPEADCFGKSLLCRFVPGLTRVRLSIDNETEYLLIPAKGLEKSDFLIYPL